MRTFLKIRSLCANILLNVIILRPCFGIFAIRCGFGLLTGKEWLLCVYRLIKVESKA